MIQLNIGHNYSVLKLAVDSKLWTSIDFPTFMRSRFQNFALYLTVSHDKLSLPVIELRSATEVSLPELENNGRNLAFPKTGKLVPYTPFVHAQTGEE